MHYLTFVLLNQSTPDVENEVARLLLGSQARPDRVYPNFEAECGCPGRKASSEGFDAFDRSERGMTLKERLSSARKAKEETAVRALLRERYFAAMEIARARDDFERVDPECDVCRGTGTYTQTRDPADHTDWWTMGGRWEGLFSAHGIGDSDVAPVRQVLGKLTPAVVVTPEGNWYEGSSNVAGGFLEDEEEATAVQRRKLRWTDRAVDLMERHADCLVVVVDCHF